MIVKWKRMWLGIQVQSKSETNTPRLWDLIHFGIVNRQKEPNQLNILYLKYNENYL